MCNFFNENQCSILSNICPWTYFCNKEQKWKFKLEGNSCKVKNKNTIPKGYYKVCFERHNNLYVEVDNCIQIIPNPYTDVPLYVKLYKLKNGEIKVKRYRGRE